VKVAMIFYSIVYTKSLGELNYGGSLRSGQTSLFNKNSPTKKSLAVGCLESLGS
jgi:hypothetical protein